MGNHLVEFRMPSLGSRVQTGTLVRWLKRPGDAVAHGDVIAIVDTEQAAIEVDVSVDFDAVLETVHVEAGDRVTAGTLLATIRQAERHERPRHEPPIVLPPAQPPRRLNVSPMALKLAADLGVNIDLLEGTGPQGAITSEDVQRADAALKQPVEPALPPPRPASSSPLPPSDAPTWNDSIAEIAASPAGSVGDIAGDIPHHHVSATIDMTAALSWLDRRPVPPIALLIKALGLALDQVPALNGYWLNGGFRAGTGIHVGYSCRSQGRGRVAPAVLNVERLDLETLARKLADLIARAQSGSLRSSELSSPTITVNDFSGEAVDGAFGTVVPPQIALVGFGRIAERPWVVAGRVEPRPLLTVNLSVDHRATDGQQAALLLTVIEKLLHDPQQL